MSKLMIVAEIGANHCRSLDMAKALVRAAKQAGADAVKFQTYTPEEIAADVPIKSGPWRGLSYRSLYAQGETPWEWHRELFFLVRWLGMVPFSSPFSVEAVHRLESIDCPIYKIASPEICHHKLIAAAAKTGKPMIISTGMAELSEIYVAADCAYIHGCNDLTVLHCLSAYPARAEDFNMETMRRLLHSNFKVGLSDHSPGIVAPVMAVAMGASVIEKHITLSRGNKGLDNKFSLEPYEFAEMVKACRTAQRALGEPTFGVRPSEKDSEQYKRSIWLVKDIKSGEVVTEQHLAILRPNYGAHPSHFSELIGMKAKWDMPPGPMTMDFVE